METKKSKFKMSYLIILLLAVLFICFIFIDTSNPGKKLLFSDLNSIIASDKYVGEDGEDVAVEIQEVIFKNDVCYILVKDSKFEEKFPTHADFYVKMPYEKFMALESAFAGKNIEFSYDKEEHSWFMAYLPSIIFFIIGGVMIFFLFRSVAGANKGAMNFGKSKGRPTISSKIKFDQIAGADEEKAELEEIVEFLQSPQKFTALGARIPKGVLLVGPPGTGKTLLAKAVAGESNVPFISISGSDFVEMFVGVGASRVRDLFEQAKKTKPCIIFIDEIDAVGRQRGAGLGGGNDEREQTLNQLLIEMDGFEANEGIIVLAATNRSDVLDPALLRPGRFDRQIYVHIPDVKGREGILKIHSKGKPLDESIDFGTLARITAGFTGADIENMLNESAILAARAKRPKIIMTDITEGINKVLMGPQKKSRLIAESERKITAYHEAGHAILGRKLENCEMVQEVSIIPRGMAGGYTLSRVENDNSYLSYNKIMDDIAMTMGGRVAEEMIFKNITTGASSDIKHATKLARKMVYDWGMSEKIGFVSLDSDGQIFVGRDYQTKQNFSEKMMSEADAEIKSIIDKNYKRAKKVLTENIALLNEMAELLLVKETIYKEEIDMLLEGKTRDEIVAFMNEREEKQREIERKIREENALKEQKEIFERKVKDGKELLKAGIITEKEYNEVIRQFEKFQQEKIKVKNQSIEEESLKENNSQETDLKKESEEKEVEKKTEKEEKKSKTDSKKETKQESIKDESKGEQDDNN